MLDFVSVKKQVPDEQRYYRYVQKHMIIPIFMLISAKSITTQSSSFSKLTYFKEAKPDLEQTK